MQQRAAESLEEMRQETLALKSQRRRSHLNENKHDNHKVVSSNEQPKQQTSSDFEGAHRQPQVREQYRGGVSESPQVINSPRRRNNEPREYHLDDDIHEDDDHEIERDSYHQPIKSQQPYFSPDKDHRHVRGYPPNDPTSSYPYSKNNIRYSYEQHTHFDRNDRHETNKSSFLPRRNNDSEMPPHNHYHHSRNYRPDSADEHDKYLSSWMEKQSLASSVQSRQMPKYGNGSNHDQNDISFVGESRFVNSSTVSVGGLFPDERQRHSRNNLPQGRNNGLKYYNDVTALHGEKSMDSESFFYFLGERPQILDNAAPIQKVSGYFLLLFQRIARHLKPKLSTYRHFDILNGEITSRAIY